MTYYADLTPCDYFGAALRGVRWSSYLRAIGWLERGQEFPKGRVPAPVFRKLFAMAREPWEPVHCMGWHTCTLCWIPRLRPRLVFLLTPPFGVVSVGITNLFVPGQRFLYIAPSMVLHYISKHRYSPPTEFCEAVRACPPFRSQEYADAIVANGPPELRSRRHVLFKQTVC